jgi:hypothetical protein
VSDCENNSRPPPHIQSLEPRVYRQGGLIDIEMVLDLVSKIRELGLGLVDV